MLPCLSMSDSSDQTLIDTEIGSDRCVGVPKFLPFLNGLDLIESQFGLPATLSSHIDDIVGLRTEKPMSRIATYAIVTPMQHEKWVRIGAMNNKPSETRCNQSSAPESGVGLAAFIASQGPDPRPALIW